MALPNSIPPPLDAGLRTRLEALAAPHGLMVMCHLDRLADGSGGSRQSLVLLGPAGGGAMWEAFRTSAEYRDGDADPLDRWSKRAILAMGKALGASAAYFPSDGPPYPPFVAWALESGQVFRSPVGLLVHPAAGLWVSFRGALLLPGTMDPAASPSNPCEPCPAPCLAACPAEAFATGSYDTARCHEFLDTPPGRDCMARGCAVRRACPAGRAHARPEAQSAFHMEAFHRR